MQVDSHSRERIKPEIQLSKQILCFGEISLDQVWIMDQMPGLSFEQQVDCHILDEKQGPGGCALNSAVILAAQGANVVLSGNAIANDTNGIALITYLKSLSDLFSRSDVNASISLLPKLDLSMLAHHDDPSVRSLFCQVFLEKSKGSRSFALMHKDLPLLKKRHVETRQKILLQSIERGKYSHIFIQPYLEELAFEIIERANASGPNFIMIQDVETNSKFIPLADCVQISISESTFAAFTDRDRELSNIAKHYQKGRCKIGLFTCGSHGVFLASEKDMTFIPQAVMTESVVDTTGCGDAFRAGFLYQLHSLGVIHPNHDQLMDAVRSGQRFGAFKATILGSNFSRKIV